MRARAVTLRSVGPKDQEEMTLHLAQVEDLHAQAMNDLQVLAQSGAEVPAELSERLNAFGLEITAAGAAIQTTEDDAQQIAAWHARVTDLQERLRQFIAVTSGERLSVTEALRRLGLWWGLGAAATVAAVGYYVWRRRRRGRRG